ncbi:hypothetical protein LIA77_04028 [Sarocladium implicatum]|nr:hypothetical protein LIA77_04028 [Sarocladium implicatum]
MAEACTCGQQCCTLHMRLSNTTFLYVGMVRSSSIGSRLDEPALWYGDGPTGRLSPRSCNHKITSGYKCCVQAAEWMRKLGSVSTSNNHGWRGTMSSPVSL